MAYKQHNEYLTKYLNGHKNLNPPPARSQGRQGQTSAKDSNSGRSEGNDQSGSHHTSPEREVLPRDVPPHAVGTMQRSKTSLFPLSRHSSTASSSSLSTANKLSQSSNYLRSDSTLRNCHTAAPGSSRSSVSSSSRLVVNELEREAKKTSSKPASAVHSKQSDTSRKGSSLPGAKIQDKRTSYTSKSYSTKHSITDLPDEMLLKIFDFLSPGDLLSCAAVNKYFRSLANDNVLWHHMFLRYVSAKSKKPVTVEPTPADGYPPFHWKRRCLCRPSDFRPERILRQLKKLSPFTGLPRDTKAVLEKLSLRWILALVASDGKEQCVIYEDDLCHFSMSLCIRWYPLEFKTTGVKSLRLYCARPVFFDDKDQPLPNSPYRRTLILEMDFSMDELTACQDPVGQDKMLSFYALNSGLACAIYKEGNGLAFITATLHYHHLVERCILGDHSRMYAPRPIKIPRDDVDGRYGFHGYSCTLELRNLRNSLWTQQFSNLFSRNESPVDGWISFQLINPDNNFERSSLNKNLSLPWKTTIFTGKILNVCIMDCTVLDEHSNPMWTTSFATSVQKLENANLRYEYDGQDLYQLQMSEPNRGALAAVLIWEEATKQYFMTSLQLRLQVSFVNSWFGTKH